MKFKYLAIASLFTTVLTGCMDDIDDNPYVPVIPEGKEAYFSINLNLAEDGRGSTRASSFARGEEWESMIYNFRIYIFKTYTPIETQEDELNAKFVGCCIKAYSAELGDDSSEGIAKSGEFKVKADYTLTSELQVAQEGEVFYYGLVMANYHQNIHYDAFDNELTKTGFFKDLYNMKVPTDNNSGYLMLPQGDGYRMTMSNAAYWPENSSQKEPLILQPIDITKVVWLNNGEKIEDKTFDGTSANFYIQRNAVKITLNPSCMAEDKVYEIKKGDFAGLKVKIKGFVPTGVNKETYLLQNTSNFTSENMKSVLENHGDRFHNAGTPGIDRVTWSSDPTYNLINDEECGDYFLYKTALYLNNDKIDFMTDVNSRRVIDNSGNTIFYCAENTLEPDAMRRNQTLMLKVHAQLTEPYDQGGFSQEATGGDNTSDSGEVIESDNLIITIPKLNKSYSANGFCQYIRENYDRSYVFHFRWSSLGMVYTFEEFMKDNKQGANAKDIAAIWGLEPSDLVCTNGSGSIYYDIPLRHFTDGQLDPLEYDGEGHPIYTANDTGRFGALRNNWYDITINEIYKAGEAAYQYIDTDFDDPSIKKGTDSDGGFSYPDYSNGSLPDIIYNYSIVNWGYQNQQTGL